jgi:hypothetical protein
MCSFSVKAPLVGRNSKKKHHSRIGSFLWSWTSLFLPCGVPVGVIFEGGAQGGDLRTDLFLLGGVPP